MASLDIETLIISARDLVRAGRWEQAVRLLDAAEPAGPRDAGALAVARADAEVDHAFWTRRDTDASLLDAARVLAADSAQAWAADFAHLRSSYAKQLFGEQSDTDALAAAAQRLAAEAPDASTRAYARFYQGLIAGVLRGDDTEAERHYYRAVLDTDDEYVRSYALRHLGALADEAGRHAEALSLWEDSTRLRQRVGFLPGVLAQLVMRDATMPLVTGWAEALGIGEALGTASATEAKVAGDKR